jgi:DNA-binding CsgD family transcriptional regulator
MARNGTALEQDADTSEAIRTRLRALVRSLDADGGRNDDSAEQVLMDADLDGQRYLLIRMPAIERKAAPLSPREVEIVRLVAEGRPNKVIAAVLEISSWTVCTHVRRVFAKLGVTSRAAMIARLAEFGGPMEMTFSPPPLPKRDMHVSNESDDAGFRGSANGHSLLRNQTVTARFIQSRGPKCGGAEKHCPAPLARAAALNDAAGPIDSARTARGSPGWPR